MKIRLLGAVAASAVMLCAAPAASAKVMVATYTGVVTFMLGDSQIFGPMAGIGSGFDLTFTYDTDLGQVTDNLPSDTGILGGSMDVPSGPSPMLLAAIRIDGVRHGFAPEADGSIGLDFANNTILHSGMSCPSFCEGMVAEFHPSAMPASLTSALDVDGTGQGNFAFIQSGGGVFAYLDLQHLNVSAAPEPQIWLSLVGGLFGAGSILRRQRRRTAAAAA